MSSGCLGVVARIFFISPVPRSPRPPAQILRRYGIYEARDEAQSAEDVADGEELADGRSWGEIS